MSTSSRSADRAADAIRYIALHKLASGLRHAMLGDLQAIELTAELCSRMLQAARDPAEIRTQLGKIASQASAAATTTRSLVEWLRPNEASVGAFGDTLRYCLGVVGDDWMLRGIKADVSVSDAASEAIVLRSAVCELVATSLLTLIDARRTPLDIELRAETVDRQVALNIDARAQARPQVIPSIPVYSKLDWDDLFVLAAAHDVKCLCERERSSIALYFAQHAESVAG